MKIIKITFVFILQMPLVCFAASFNCDTATTKIETTICENSELSDLDEVLARTYGLVLDVAPNPIALKSQQRKWIATVIKECNDSEDCIQRVYEQRISELEGIWHERTLAMHIAPGSVRNLTKPFEGEWRHCDIWNGKEICEYYKLVQKGKQVCGEWNYWATNREYNGQFEAVAESSNQANLKLICGDAGSSTKIDCQDGWERTKAEIQICNNFFHYRDGSFSCGSVKQEDGFYHLPLSKVDRSRLLSQPWVKSCLVKIDQSIGKQAPFDSH